MEQNRFATSAQSKTRPVDAGLKAHMNAIYTKMTAGVLVTALVAWFVSTSPFLLNLFLNGPQKYIVLFAPLAIVWFGFNPERMAASKLRIAFFALATVYGISFSSIAVMATANQAFGADVARAFFVATAMFGGLSVFGYTTKKDLTPVRTFASMAIWGLIAVSVMNIFMQSSFMGNAIAGVGIVLFGGITAWQTQAMRQMYNPNTSKEYSERMGWSAALTLYISFIAMFQYVLHFMSQR